QFARPRLAQRNIANAGNSQSMRGLRGIEPEQFARGNGGRKSPVGNVIDSLLAQAASVAQPALDFVGENRRRDERPAGRFRQPANTENSSKVVAGVSGFLG